MTGLLNNLYYYYFELRFEQKDATLGQRSAFANGVLKKIAEKLYL